MARRGEFIATIILAIAGVSVALILGIGEWRIAETQVETAQSQALASHIIALGDGSGRVRNLAAIALAEFGERAIPSLMLALGDEYKETRLAAVHSLVSIYKVHKTSKVIKEVMRGFPEEKNRNVIEAYVLILVRTKKLDELLTIVKKAEWGPLMSVIDTLEQRERYDLLEALLELKDLSVTNRINIITAMGNVAVAIGKLDEFSKIGNLDEDVRIKLVITLDNIMEERPRDDASASLIKPTLLGFLKDDSDRVRANAVSALEKFCNQSEVREALQRVLQQDEAKLVRDMARLVLESKKCKKF